jgi:hypothetical protein
MFTGNAQNIHDGRIPVANVATQLTGLFTEEAQIENGLFL